MKIRNPKTGNLMSRIPDVGNPWLDAGIVPFSTMGYNTDRAYWEKWFPADFITESVPRPVPQLVLRDPGHEHDDGESAAVQGAARPRAWCAIRRGEEMHKSKGNSIPFEGAADTGYKIKNKQGKTNSIRRWGPT